jgi:hypothetical protein
MNTLKKRLERVEIEEKVNIPTADGAAVARTVAVQVPAWRDPKDGEIYLDGEGTAILDQVKARHVRPEGSAPLPSRSGPLQS